MIVFLLHRETHVGCAFNLPIADQIAAMFGYRLDFFDKYGSLETAWRAYDGYSWVYLDVRGIRMDEFRHPETDAVYVIGSDDFGLPEKLNGPRVSLYTVAPGHEWHAFPVGLVAMCERWAAVRS